jgi:hypothetical integral membrane protein (TIGR02206 family)
MRLFSPEHLAAIAATVLGALALTLAGGGAEKGRLSTLSGTTPRAIVLARGLAVVIAAGFVVEQVAYVARGEWSARVNLPLQLSDAVTLVAIAALWRPRPGVLSELVWFWGLSASLQAVLTPDLGETFPDVLFFTYFATHSGAVAGACLLVLGMGLIPRPREAWRAFGLTVAFAALAAIGCVATGGNYMFLRHKPANGSILDAMGPWPVYLAAAAAFGLAMLLVLQAIAWWLRRRGRASRTVRAAHGA